MKVTISIVRVRVRASRAIGLLPEKELVSQLHPL